MKRVLQIGARAIAAAEERERQEKHQEESTLASLENFLKLHDFEKARALAMKWGSARYRQAIMQVFRRYPPETRKCSVCQNNLTSALDRIDLRWVTTECSHCQQVAVREGISGRCEDIMLARGVSKRFLKAILSDFPEQYRDTYDEEKGLFIFGSRGVGKTHFLAAILRDEILRTPLPALRKELQRLELSTEIYSEPAMSDYPSMVSVPELLLRIRETFDPYASATESGIVAEYGSVGTLMLDDLGVEKPSEWVLQTLHLIIDRRYRDLRRTFITSNYSLDEIAKRLDDRISSRIAGMCNVVQMTGDDRRVC